MADRYEEPMATLGELATHDRDPIGRELVIIEYLGPRRSLRETITDYPRLKASQLVAFLSRRAEEKPVAAIFIGLGVGLIAGELLRRAVWPRRR